MGKISTPNPQHRLLLQMSRDHLKVDMLATEVKRKRLPTLRRSRCRTLACCRRCLQLMVLSVEVLFFGPFKPTIVPLSQLLSRFFFLLPAAALRHEFVLPIVERRSRFFNSFPFCLLGYKPDGFRT
ncbi:hypothetical protein T01_14315 [Trichinella spiralis]|uniref:Uncharacterized protein n=1 Tax=Trichinella spiralis TaxID=6334 RepID=A0A0V1BRB4_TRISP|nr:hypothetical protein T01_14315 [Trichinella spiralis]